MYKRQGYNGARSKQYRVAKQSVMKAMAYSFAGRKQTKREYRALWITRINAAARKFDISYSQLMHGLKTVSYTHLDVYKRQVHQCLMLWDSTIFGWQKQRDLQETK